jgi:hypothetical protein
MLARSGPSGQTTFFCMEFAGKRKEMENTSVIDQQLQLSAEEDSLFRLLCDVVEHFKLQAVLRVAGGWVRDKLMASTTQFMHRGTRPLYIHVDNDI